MIRLSSGSARRKTMRINLRRKRRKDSSQDTISSHVSTLRTILTFVAEIRLKVNRIYRSEFPDWK